MAEIDRRQFLHRAAATTLAAAIPGPLRGLIRRMPGERVRALATGPFVAYHGVDAATHQAKFDELGGQGWRIDWLNVAGDPGNPRYAAVWVPNDGRAWFATHGIDAATYQAKFDEFVGKGAVPTVVSATGESSPVFAAVFEQRSVGGWFARHGIDFNTLAAANEQARRDGQVPHCLAMYGPANDRRFAGTWWTDVNHDAWDWCLAPASDYQRWFDAFSGGGERPISLSVAGDGAILAVFRNSFVAEWTAIHRRDAANYQAEFDANNGAARRPVVIAAGGPTGDLRYAAAFADSLDAPARQWSVTGSASPAGNAFDAALDAVIADVAQRFGARAASVAVARNGALRVARAYTWAEPGYPVTQPSSVFRVASISKLFASALATRQIADGLLTSGTSLFDTLGSPTPLPTTATPDANSAKVTVGNVLDQNSGLQRDLNGARFRDVSIAAGHNGPPTLDEVVRYIRGLPLIAGPGMGSYSNSAFHVLNLVLERTSGRTFIDDLNRRVLGPEGFGDVFVASTRPGVRAPGEVPGYDASFVGPSTYDTAADAIAAVAYGGDVFTDSLPAAGGLATSTPTIARFIASHAVWGGGGRTLATRYGNFAGTAAMATSRADGLDVAVLVNRDISDADKDALMAKIHGLLDSVAASI